MKINKIGNNETELHTANAVILFSYNTPVAARINGKVYRTSEKYSTTTSRHIGSWLGASKCTAEVRDPAFFETLADNR